VFLAAGTEATGGAVPKTIAFLVGLVLLLALFHRPILTAVGRWLVRSQPVAHADAAVVLNTGVNIYARMIEAAALYREGVVDKVVINGNRKNDVLRRLEAKGFRPSQAWYAERVELLEFLQVDGDDVIAVSAEDAYDTVSEARYVGQQLIARGIRSVVVTTSKFHTRRAGFVWRSLYGDRLTIHTAAARDDPFDPPGWWHSGRQVRWVMAEYGAWLFFYWKKLTAD
jgi:uncharacterized SAM-binding protein YcdF (DUF218 family)